MLFLNNAHGTGGGGGAREGCTGGQGRVCRWSGEGVLVVRGGCAGGQGRVYVTRHNGYYNSRSLCKIYGKGIMTLTLTKTTVTY